MKLFTARSLVVAPGVFHAGGGILCDDRVRRVAASQAEARRLARHAAAPIVDLGEVVLAPGLVDAHAHLELTGIDVGPDRSFRAWVEGLMAARRGSSRAACVAAARRGADRLLETGTTAVGDVDSTGAAAAALLDHALRARVYREVLDGADPERTAAALERVSEPPEWREGLQEGVSPHAPYTVSPGLFEAVRELARRRSLPVTIHWAETEEETEWTLRGSGPLAGLVARSPLRAGLDLIEEAGLLQANTSLVHGNHPAPGEIERVARAGSACVHCPGSHAYFDRRPFPLESYLRAGVPIALGTDSGASNEDLDMRREMSLFRSANAGVAPELVWAMATVNAARAIGVRDAPGTLHVGARADFCAYAIAPAGAAQCFDQLTGGGPAVLGSWIAGHPVHGAVA